MSETFPSAEQTEYQDVTTEHSGNGYINPDWDDSALTSFVEANADVLVSVGGSEMTLSSYALGHPGPWTQENQKNLLAEFQQLLNASKETEKLEEETEDEQDGPRKAEELDEQENLEDQRKENLDKEATQDEEDEATPGSPKEAVNQPKNVEQTAVPVETTLEIDEIDIQASTPEPAVDTAKVQASAMGQSHVAVPPTTAEGSSIPDYSASTHNDETPAAVSSAPENTTTDSTSEVSIYEFVPQMMEEEMQPAVKTGVEPVVLDEASEEVAFYKAEVVLGEQEELSDEKETDENNLEPLGYQIEDVISKDVAEEWPIELAEDIAGDEQPLIYTVENKSDPAIRVEEAGREIPAESYSTDDEVENTLIALMEYIETSDAETAETVNEILDKIIELGVKLEGEITEITPAEVEVQEELEELFIELLDTLGMDYSMESIETLARMIVEWQPNDIEELDMYELEGLLNDSGTHEAIKQLLAGLGNRKNASMPIFVIGRSALQLYSFDSRSTAGVA